MVEVRKWRRSPRDGFKPGVLGWSGGVEARRLVRRRSDFDGRPALAEP